MVHESTSGHSLWRALGALVLFLCLAPVLRAQETGSDVGERSQALRVAAVQLQIRQSDLRSYEAFKDHIEALVERCLAFRPDLIVFPEYTSVFLALIPHYPVIRSSGSALEGIAAISAQDPLIGGFRDLFLLNSGLVERALEEIFAVLAARHQVAILAGTYFAWSRRDQEVELVNRAVLYDSKGKIAYTQDKVYLTPFEEQLLGIAPGHLREAEPIELRGREIGLTICRDTFFPAWQQIYSGVDLWIDIKANGTAFTQEERERFQRAVPARIREGDIPYGLTVCLTGSLLDLLWEGESSLVGRESAQDNQFLQKSNSAAAEEILFITIED